MAGGDRVGMITMKESSSSKGGDHNDVGSCADLVVHEFFHFVHLLAHVDELELVDGHSFLVLDVLLEHAHRVLLLVSARQLSVSDSSDLEGRHPNITLLFLSSRNPCSLT